MAAKKSSPQACTPGWAGYLGCAVSYMHNKWHSSPNAYIPPPLKVPLASSLETITLRSCKFPTPQTHPGKQPLQTAGNLQIYIPAMEYNLARCSIQLPAQGMYLMTTPRFIQRPQHKHSQYRISSKLPTGHPCLLQAGSPSQNQSSAP